jgi:ClpP class serine protease
VQAADADPSVKSIVIHADTPGGMVGGVPELADAIANARKPVEVRVNGMLASAGVWAAAGADTITATRSSEIGSIGVYTVRVDTSQALADKGIKVHLVSSGGVKGAGADGRVTAELLAEDARIVGQLRDAFVSAVSAGRGRDLSARATGQVWLAADAQRIGGASPSDTTEESMDLSPLAALAAKHPTKAADILKLAADGKTDAEIAQAMDAAAHADEIAAAKLAVTEASAKADKAAADLKAEQDKSAALAAEVAELKDKLAAAEKSKGKIDQLAKTAAKDPGDNSQVAPQEITRAEYERNPAAYADRIRLGTVSVK